MRINKIKRQFGKIVNDLPDTELFSYAYAFCKEAERRSGKCLAEILEAIFNLDKLVNGSEDKTC